MIYNILKCKIKTTILFLRTMKNFPNCIKIFISITKSIKIKFLIKICIIEYKNIETRLTQPHPRSKKIFHDFNKKSLNYPDIFIKIRPILTPE